MGVSTQIPDIFSIASLSDAWVDILDHRNLARVEALSLTMGALMYSSVPLAVDAGCGVSRQPLSTVCERPSKIV